MRCLFCLAEDTKVVDSRLVGEGEQVRRRRQCISCDERFTTYETAEVMLPRIIKRDGARVNFDEQKLRAGMMRALEKRPVSADAIEGVVTRIKNRLKGAGDREIQARVLGDWVMEELKILDPVAYVRFASVYRCFQDVNAFKEEIDRLSDVTAHIADVPVTSEG